MSRWCPTSATLLCIAFALPPDPGNRPKKQGKQAGNQAGRRAADEQGERAVRPLRMGLAPALPRREQAPQGSRNVWHDHCAAQRQPALPWDVFCQQKAVGVLFSFPHSGGAAPGHLWQGSSCGVCGADDPFDASIWSGKKMWPAGCRQGTDASGIGDAIAWVSGAGPTSQTCTLPPHNTHKAQGGAAEAEMGAGRSRMQPQVSQWLG